MANRRTNWGPLVVAVITWCVVATELDPAGSYPARREGPGLTADEIFNVEMGVFFVASVVGGEPIFSHPGYNPDHPPLGRWILGFVHQTARWMDPPADHDSPFSVASARHASALLFAITVWFVGWTTQRWFGDDAAWSGAAASLICATSPRLLGHAHLASLETSIGFFYLLAFAVAGTRWAGARNPTAKSSVVVGAVCGLALLTKIQAVLIPPVLTVWSIWIWRSKAIAPLAIAGLSTAVVFFLGWPWLWLDPVEHTLTYFGRSVDRVTLYANYFGTRFADTDVPWHYAWVYFVVTVPVCWLVTGFVGVVRCCGRSESARRVFRWSVDPRAALLVLGILAPLVLFTLPGVPVYDGPRLFLVVFPLWSMLAGVGLVRVAERVKQRWSKWAARLVLTVSTALPIVSIVSLWPCSLSYYNALTGLTWGASQLGLDSTYWGDSVTRTFLTELADAVPQGGVVAVTPPLHEFHLPELERQSPILRAREIRLVRFDQEPAPTAEYVLMFRRRADLPPEWEGDPPPDTELVVATVRQGVNLAALYRLPHPGAGVHP